MAALRLTITGMTCDHCRSKVEAALKEVSGVYGVYVDLEGGAAEVDYNDSRAKPEAMAAAVDKVGYGAEIAS